MIVFIIYAISAILLSLCIEDRIGSTKKTLAYIYLIRLVSGFAGVI